MIHDTALLDKLDSLPKITFDGQVCRATPSARWNCENLILFPDNTGFGAALETVSTEDVDWIVWSAANGLIDESLK